MYQEMKRAADWNDGGGGRRLPSTTCCGPHSTSRSHMNDRAQRSPGEVLRLRNLAMIENIRRAEDPAWCKHLEQQQGVARLGRMFGRNASPLEAMLDYAHARKEELRATPLPWCRPAGRSRVDG
jgi:hypothetical protein